MTGDKKAAEQVKARRWGGGGGGTPALTLLRLLRSLTLLVSCWISATWSASRFCSLSFSASVSSSVRASCRDSLSGWPLGVFFSMSCQDPERAGNENRRTPADPPPPARGQGLTLPPPAETRSEGAQLSARTDGIERGVRTPEIANERKNKKKKNLWIDPEFTDQQCPQLEALRTEKKVLGRPSAWRPPPPNQARR